jgi:hypothetical protein
MNKTEKAAALASGIRVSVEKHVDAGFQEIRAEMARVRGGQTSNQIATAHQGLGKLLRKQVPECEQELIDLHIRFGEADPEAIGEKISSLLKERVVAGARSIGASLRGRGVPALRRTAAHLEGQMAMRKRSIVDRARLALGLQATQKPPKRGIFEKVWPAVKDELIKSPIKIGVGLVIVVLIGYLRLRDRPAGLPAPQSKVADASAPPP